MKVVQAQIGIFVLFGQKETRQMLPVRVRVCMSIASKVVGGVSSQDFQYLPNARLAARASRAALWVSVSRSPPASLRL